MLCDDCGRMPALIDHWDLGLAQGGPRHLCRDCAEREREEWNRERERAFPAGPRSLQPRPA